MAGAIEALEREFAAWLGVRGALAAGFGRSALALALEAVGVRDGDVSVPDFICAQVPEAVRRSGARPVFYRVGRDLSVHPDEFRDALTPRTRVAILAHYFGRALPEAPAVAEICRERGVLLIEDCALALGASLGSRGPGTWGNLAAFSFTKAGWCYGGGLLASDSSEWLERARAIRERECARDRRLSFAYGVLRRFDFAANRPSECAVAERAGKWLEGVLLPGPARRAHGNFYDAGRFDARMPEFAARRARGVLAALAAEIDRRRAIKRQLVGGLEHARPILVGPDEDAGDAASFLVLRSPAGRSHAWVQEAAQARVTLRLCWPAYQHLEPGQASESLHWLADHLLFLEIHPRLRAWEQERIVECLQALAARE